jgi:hypothetical protein
MNVGSSLRSIRRHIIVSCLPETPTIHSQSVLHPEESDCEPLRGRLLPESSDPQDLKGRMSTTNTMI